MRKLPRILFVTFVLLSTVRLGATAANDPKVVANTHFNKAIAYQKAGKLGLAAQEYQAVLKVVPNLAPALNNLSIIYMQRQQYANAESALIRLLASDPKNESVLQRLTQCTIEQNKGKDAITYARKLMALKPDNRRYKAVFAAANMAAKDYNAAADVFRTLIHSDPKDKAPYLSLAYCYMSMKQQSDAIDTLDSLLKIAPNDAQARFFAAGIAEKIGDKQTAIKHYEAASTGPAAVQALLNLARLYRSTMEPEKSVNAMKRILKIDANNFDASFNLGAYEYSKGNFKQAESYWKKATSVRQKDPMANMNLAMAQARQRKFKEALVGAQIAYKAKPKDDMVAEAYGYVLECCAKLDEALAVYKDWEKNSPKDSIPNRKMAQIYLFQDKQEPKAWAQFDLAIKKDPKNIDIYTAYADALSMKGKYEDAYKQYQKAMNLKPGDASLMVRTAASLEMQKKPNEAISLLKKAANADAKNEEARIRLARLYNDQGNKDAAIAEYKAAIAINYKSQAALISLAQLYSEKDDTTNEIEMYRKLVKLNPSEGFRFGLANALEKTKDFDGALSEYNALETSTDTGYKTQALIHKGAVLEKQGKPTEAIAVYEKVLGFNANDQVLNALSKLYDDQKNPDGFISCLKSLIDSSKTGAPYQYYLDASTKAGKHDEAMNTLEAALLKAPDNVILLSVLASAYKASGKNDQAIEAYKKILAKFPQDYVANRNLGYIYKSLDKKQEAADCLKVVADQSKTDAQLLLDLGKLYEDLGKKSEAKSVYLDYLKYNPGNSEIKRKVSELEAAQPAEPVK